MLVLTREIGEAITIGNNIKITVAKIKGNQIGFGIDAPRSVMVAREEIYIKDKKAPATK